jgi:hypothetical protein
MGTEEEGHWNHNRNNRSNCSIRKGVEAVLPLLLKSRLFSNSVLNAWRRRWSGGGSSARSDGWTLIRLVQTPAVV